MKNLNPLYEYKEFTRKALASASRSKEGTKKVTELALKQSAQRAKKSGKRAAESAVEEVTRRTRRGFSTRTPTEIGNSIWGQ